MLPSFVIGLREGLEAALIVGIIAAFLRKQGRKDLLRWVLIGVGTAVVLCFAAGVALNVYSKNLPQRQQEGLETVIGVLAIGMVSYMVIWMRRNSRQLKGQLEGMAADAMEGTSNAGRAMVLMAFLAVIREGLETVVFLLAAFNETGSSSTAGLGALLGILVAVGLGYGIYRGGVRLNLSKFFRATGLVLVLVAAGLVVNALHTAHEAGWLDIGQQQVVDLGWLVQGGTVQSSLLTGMLGIQPRPVAIEVLGWLFYLIPVGLYVAWPPGRAVPTRATIRAGVIIGAVAAVGAVVLALLTPSAPAVRETTTAGDVSATVVSRQTQTAVVRTQEQQAASGQLGATANLRVAFVDSVQHDGLAADKYQLRRQVDAGAGRPTSLSIEEVSRLNGNRLPIGIRATSGSLSAAYRGAETLTVWLDERTDRVLDLRWQESVTATVSTSTQSAGLDDPVASGTRSLPRSAAERATAAARADHDTLDQRSLLHTLTGWCVALAVIALLIALGFFLASRRNRRQEPVATPVASLVRS